jgi:ferritin-like metal-binding protein YciE
MKMDNLRDLLIDNIKDLHSAETQLTKALPKMAASATHPDLRRAFDSHLYQTQRHVERLEQALTLLNANGKPKKCKGMEGLIDEGKEVLDEKMANDVKDAALIGAAQKVEHYEIAGYGTAVTYAGTVGATEVAQLLRQTLEEEKQTDQQLTMLAEMFVNEQAA